MFNGALKDNNSARYEELVKKEERMFALLKTKITDCRAAVRQTLAEVAAFEVFLEAKEKKTAMKRKSLPESKAFVDRVRADLGALNRGLERFTN